jgi:hypothetical protein
MTVYCTNNSQITDSKTKLITKPTKPVNKPTIKREYKYSCDKTILAGFLYLKNDE